MGSRFGARGAARRRCPPDEWPWHGSLRGRGLESFTWFTFDDDKQPYAVGMKIVSGFTRGAVYTIVEWYGPQDVRRSHWRFQTDAGWTQLNATD